MSRRNADAEGPWTILGSLVGVIGLILFIGGQCGKSESTSAFTHAPSKPAEERVVRRNLQAWEDSLQKQIRPGGLYEVVRVVREHSSLTDPETGFVYATAYIGGFFNRYQRAVSSRYAPPGERIRPPGVYEWMAGETVAFNFGQRRFVFVLEEVDTRNKAVVVRIKELPLPAARAK